MKSALLSAATSTSSHRVAPHRRTHHQLDHQRGQWFPHRRPSPSWQRSTEDL